jgi:hypothetical protein
MSIDRRSFLAGSIALASSANLHADDNVRFDRRLFDAVTGEPLSSVKINAKAQGTKGRFKFNTDANGEYPFGEILSLVSQPTLYRFRISPQSLNFKYAGIDLYAIISPLPEKNQNIGNFGILPLESPGPIAGLYDPDFNNNWLDTIKAVCFSQERQDSDYIPRKTAEGALPGFKTREINVMLSTRFSKPERNFIRSVVPSAIWQFSGHSISVEKIKRIRHEQIPHYESDLPRNYILLTKRDDFPRPAVRVRYGNTLPSDELNGENPNAILASLVILDTFTMEQLFRRGRNGPEQIEHSRSIIQRTIAGALGWNPVNFLQGISVMDNNYAPPDMGYPVMDSEYDAAIALAVNGHGSACYPPGTRFNDNEDFPILRSDPNYPLNYEVLA